MQNLERLGILSSETTDDSGETLRILSMTNMKTSADIIGYTVYRDLGDTCDSWASSLVPLGRVAGGMSSGSKPLLERSDAGDECSWIPDSSVSRFGVGRFGSRIVC